MVMNTVNIYSSANHLMQSSDIYDQFWFVKLLLILTNIMYAVKITTTAILLLLLFPTGLFLSVMLWGQDHSIYIPVCL